MDTNSKIEYVLGWDKYTQTYVNLEISQGYNKIGAFVKYLQTSLQLLGASKNNTKQIVYIVYKTIIRHI